MPFEAKLEATFRIPVVTWPLIALCAAVVGWQCLAGQGALSGLPDPGYVGGAGVAQGEVWGLLWSFFLHGGIFHIAFNMYVLYRLGPALELWLGWKRFLLFWVAGTAVSSMAEYAISSDVGVGASG